MALVLLLSMALFAYAGPFGLEPGLTIEQLRAIDPDIKEEDNNSFLMSVVPIPSKSFEMYRVYVHPTVGLVKLIAYGITIQTNRFGVALLAEFNRVESALSEQYGTAKNYNFLITGSIWKDPQDWMMGLVQEERILASFWTKDVIKSDTVDSIGLVANALSSDKGYILIEYEFKGFAEHINDFKPKERF